MEIGVLLELVPDTQEGGFIERLPDELHADGESGGGVTAVKTTLAVTTAVAKEAFSLAKKSASQFRSAGQS